MKSGLWIPSSDTTWMTSKLLCVVCRAEIAENHTQNPILRVAELPCKLSSQSRRVHPAWEYFQERVRSCKVMATWGRPWCSWGPWASRFWWVSCAGRRSPHAYHRALPTAIWGTGLGETKVGQSWLGLLRFRCFSFFFFFRCFSWINAPCIYHLGLFPEFWKTRFCQLMPAFSFFYGKGGFLNELITLFLRMSPRVM